VLNLPLGIQRDQDAIHREALTVPYVARQLSRGWTVTRTVFAKGNGLISMLIAQSGDEIVAPVAGLGKK